MEIKINELEILANPNDYALGELVRQKYWEIKNVSQKKIYDDCVICGRQSPYTIDTHVDIRLGYIEGMGQGCFQEKSCKE
jgi:hypothetical protein